MGLDGWPHIGERRVGTRYFRSLDVVYRVDGLGYNQQNLALQSIRAVLEPSAWVLNVLEIGWAVDSEEYSESPVWFEKAVLVTESYRTKKCDSTMNDYGEVWKLTGTLRP